VKFGQAKSSQESRESVRKDKDAQKKISKKIGEYIDYEEVKKSGRS
jgi:hypothetical protein